MNAIALNSSMFNGARVIGPMVAGILVPLIGEGWCFAANAISYVAVIINLFLMRVHCAPRASKHSPSKNIIEGFRWVNQTKVIRALLFAGTGELGRHAYTVLMPSLPTKSSTARPRTGHPDGRNRSRRALRGPDASGKDWSERPGPLGGIRLRRFASACVFFSFSHFFGVGVL